LGTSGSGKGKGSFSSTSRTTVHFPLSANTSAFLSANNIGKKQKVRIREQQDEGDKEVSLMRTSMKYLRQRVV
jgi:hypothetical protein